MSGSAPQFYELGEVRPPRESDFAYFEMILHDQEGWKQKYHRHRIHVYMRKMPDSNIKVAKCVAQFRGITADQLYDTLQDPIYREQWERITRESRVICSVGQNSYIEYYGLRSPLGFTDRDFVLHRFWGVYKNSYMIINRSVFHKQYPPNNDYIRAMCFLNGYMITPTGPDSCEMYYFLNTNLRGDIPKFVIDLVTKFMAPRSIRGLRKAVLKYVEWKAQNSPNFKPWRNPRQQDPNIPPVNMRDVLPRPDFPLTNIKETHFDEKHAYEEVNREYNNDDDEDESSY